MYCAFWILENITFSDFGLSYLIVSCVGREMIPPTPCNLPAFMVQYSGIQKNVSDSACCVVRHTDAGPVRWIRCEPGQVGNQAALSSAFVRFSKPASVCRVTQAGGQTPSALSVFFCRTVSYLRSYKYRDNCCFVYRNICCLKWNMQWIILFLILFCRGNV